MSGAVLLAAAMTLGSAAFGTMLAVLLGGGMGIALALWRRGPFCNRAGAELWAMAAAPVLSVLAAALGLSGPANAVLAIGLAGSGFVAAAVWQEASALRRLDFVLAARLAGLSPLNAAQRHLLPRFLPFVAALALQWLATAILLETMLAYAGLGAMAGGSLGGLLREAQGAAGDNGEMLLLAGGGSVVLAATCRLGARGLRALWPPPAARLNAEPIDTTPIPTRLAVGPLHPELGAELIAFDAAQPPLREAEVVGLVGGDEKRRAALLLGLRQHGAYLFADPVKAFNPALPVGTTLTEPMRLEQRLIIEEQADRLIEAVRAVGLAPELLERLPRVFSRFDLLRLALARALVGRPRLLLLTEPLARLEPEQRAGLLRLLERLRGDYGVAILITAAAREELGALADRVVDLDGGVVEMPAEAPVMAEAAEPAVVLPPDA